MFAAAGEIAVMVLIVNLCSAVCTCMKAYGAARGWGQEQQRVPGGETRASAIQQGGSIKDGSSYYTRVHVRWGLILVPYYGCTAAGATVPIRVRVRVRPRTSKKVVRSEVFRKQASTFLIFYSSIRIRDVSGIPSYLGKSKRQGSFIYLLSWKCAGTRTS